VTCFYVGEFVAARSLPEQCHRLGDPAHCAGAGICRSLCDRARASRLHLGELHEAMSDPPGGRLVWRRTGSRNGVSWCSVERQPRRSMSSPRSPTHSVWNQTIWRLRWSLISMKDPRCH
jgi:hypothetical protein